MKRKSVLAALLGLVAMAVNGSPVEWQAGETVVKVEFFNEDVGHYCQARECGRDAEGQHMEEQRADGKA